MKGSISVRIVALALAGAVGFGLIGCAGIHRSAEPGEERSAPVAGHSEHEPTLTPAKATALLVEGNARFAAGRGLHPHQSPERRRELATGQRPFAVIIGCADSRTSPELIFDQGLGDLFVIRVAGDVLDDVVLGSVEYAVEHLHSGLVVALGHQRCGAVAAARETVAAQGHAEGHIDSLVGAIRPAVEATANQGAEATCRANVLNTVRALRTSDPILRQRVEAGRIAVVGAYYDLETGVVTFLTGQ